MNNKSKIKINQDFFKTWSPEMAYVLGFVVADGCIIKRKNGLDSYVFNLTSKDKELLQDIKEALNFDYKIGIKYNSLKMPYSQIQICNSIICKDLIKLGIHPKKTYNLQPIEVPKEYFPDFVRGFFDGDGSVYIYKVNKTPQIKSSFVAATSPFITDFNERLCKSLKISEKSIHKLQFKDRRMPQYSICLYVNDSEKLAEFMYGNNPTLCLKRKKDIFDKWKLIKRRHYIKQNYPSKIGWRLNEGLKI